MRHPLSVFALLLAGVLAVLPLQRSCAGNVYVSRFWHNHQPIYWPEWNSSPQPERVQFARNSIDLKSGQLYDSGVAHPENDLSAIFSVGDRINAYQSGPRNSLANVNSGGYAMSYSGSLIDNVASLGAANSLGYGSGWWNGNREARNWKTSGGSPKLDLVGFTYHHSLGAVLPKEVFRKEIQIFKEAYYKAWGTGGVTNHSKGFFPTEMAFSRHMIDVLSDEGYQWAIVASHHLSRTLPSYMGDPSYTSPENNSWKIFSSPPNPADQLGSASGGAWWFGTGNVGETARNYAPYAYQLHRAQYVNPETGAVKSIIMVPSDDIQSYKAGYSGWQKGLIDGNIAPYANDPSRPCLVMPSTDGDNAWGGGSSSWDGDAPGLMNNGTYPGVAIQDFVNQYGGSADTVHIEDGAWIFPESDYGSPNFLKWVEPPVAHATATNRVYNTQVDIETPGFATKFYSWAPVIAGANWCQTAEQMMISEGGSVQAWKIQDPYDNLNSRSYSNPNLVERAWHIYLAGLDSGFNYYGGLGNDDEIKSSLATRRAYELLNSYVNARKATNDRTPPTVFKPQRFPYNPGGYTFGWINSIPGNNSALKKMNSEFYVWTHAYDVSGITNIVLKIRKDNDGTNSLASKVNEVYDPAALGLNTSEVGAWVSIPMTQRVLPSTAAALTAAANNSQIQYFSQAVSPVVADYYFAKIDNSSFPGFRNNLFDYYIEATDARGNVSKSDIQHVFVADDAGGGGGGGGGGGTPSGPVVTSPSPPVAGQSVTITYDPTGRVLSNAASVNIHYGYNGSNWTTAPGVAMSKSNSIWTFTYTIPSDASNVVMCFNQNSNPWDNNGEANWTFAVTNMPITNPPAAPTGFVASAITSSNVVLNWNPSATASSYTLIRNGQSLTVTAGTNFTDSGVEPEKNYNYSLYASNSFGLSADSSEVFVATPFAPLGANQIRLINPTNAAQVYGGAYFFRGRAGSAFTNGLTWTNPATGQSGQIAFPGGNPTNGWEWSANIPLGPGSNRVTFTGLFTGSPTQVLTDSPTNYTAWSNGATGGSGFGAWTLATNGSAGHFFGSTSANGDMNVGSSTGFGLWGNPGTSTARRDFNTPMAAGDSFNLRFDNNSIANGGEVGFALTDSSNNTRFRFYFVGGQSNYRITDATTARDSGLAWTNGGLNLTLTLTSSNTYTFSNGTTNLTGTLSALGGPISRLIVENKSAGGGNNLYFGNMTHTRSVQESGTNFVTAATLTYMPITDGLPNDWWNQYFGTTSGVSASADPDGDGFSNAQEYALGTHPLDSSSSLRITSIERNGTNTTVTWTAVGGKTYQLEGKPTLGSLSWSNMASAVTATNNATNAFSQHGAIAEKHFYRVRLVTPQ